MSSYIKQAQDAPGTASTRTVERGTSTTASSADERPELLPHSDPETFSTVFLHEK